MNSQSSLQGGGFFNDTNIPLPLNPAQPTAAMCCNKRSFTCNYNSMYTDEISLLPKATMASADGFSGAPQFYLPTHTTNRYGANKCRLANRGSYALLKTDDLYTYGHCCKMETVHYPNATNALQYPWIPYDPGQMTNSVYCCNNAPVHLSQSNQTCSSQYFPEAANFSHPSMAQQVDLCQAQNTQNPSLYFDPRSLPSANESADRVKRIEIPNGRYCTISRHSPAERPYVCTQCGKSFVQKGSLKAHRRTHSGIHVFDGNIRCYDKKFLSISGEKPFSCPICHRLFTQTSSLMTHKRTHTGEKPYRCTYCVKAFSDNSTLTKHMRTHTGQKPYECRVCLMKFSQSGNRSRHMKIHQVNAPAT